MTEKLKLELNYKEIKTEYLININEKNLNKFVEQCLNTFDDVLRNIISISKFDKAYDDTDETEKVAIDNRIDELKDE